MGLHLNASPDKSVSIAIPTSQGGHDSVLRQLNQGRDEKAAPSPCKISTLTHQESKGPEEGEETISRAKLQEPLKKLREERPVPSAIVQGAPRPSVLETNPTKWPPLYPTVPTDLTKNSTIEFNLFQQRRDAVSTKQAAALNLNLTQRAQRVRTPQGAQGYENHHQRTTPSIPLATPKLA